MVDKATLLEAVAVLVAVVAGGLAWRRSAPPERKEDTQMTAQPIVPGDLIARTQTIAGLRALADFLENNPTVPVREFGEEYTVFAQRAEDDATERAEIDHIAEALEETVEDDTADGGHYTASKTFGRITYRAVHIPARRKAAHDALMSYAPAFDKSRAA